jgi:hypothetical protein
MMQTNKTVKKTEMWRRYKGKTAEELCAAIRELWLAKYPEYIRMLNEIPNRLIEEVATLSWPFDATQMYGEEMTTLDGSVIPDEEARAILDRIVRRVGRNRLKDLEKFLTKRPFGDYMSENLLFEETFEHENPDAPLSEYVEADKRRDGLVEMFSIRPNEHV